MITPTLTHSNPPSVRFAVQEDHRLLELGLLSEDDPIEFMGGNCSK